MGLSIMTTAAYSFDSILEICRAVRVAFGRGVTLIGNTGRSQATSLADAGQKL